MSIHANLHGLLPPQNRITSTYTHLYSVPPLRTAAKGRCVMPKVPDLWDSLLGLTFVIFVFIDKVLLILLPLFF
jgi:hypothetical protein